MSKYGSYRDNFLQPFGGDFNENYGKKKRHIKGGTIDQA